MAAATVAEIMSRAPEANVSATHRAVRRFPVLDDDRVVGTIGVGDLGIERDESSALADISAADSNRWRRTPKADETAHELSDRSGAATQARESG